MKRDNTVATVVILLVMTSSSSSSSSSSQQQPHWLSSPAWERLAGDSEEMVVLGEMDDADLEHSASHVSGPRLVYHGSTEELRTSSLLDDNAMVIVKDLNLLAEDSERDQAFLRDFLRQHEVYVKVDGEADILLNVLGKLPLLLDSKLFAVDTERGTITEFFRYAEDRNLVGQEVPCPGEDAACSPMKEVWMRRNNLTGITLRAVYAIWPPWSTEPEEEGDLPGGMDLEIFLHVQQMLGFGIEAVPSVDGSWGGLQGDNVTFSGMVGMFQRGEVDVSMVSFSFNEDRARVLDYSSPTYNLALKIIARPNVGNFDFFDLFGIFRQEAVYALAIVCLLVAIGQSIMFVMERDGSFRLLGNALHGSAVVFKSVVLMGHSRVTTLVSGKVLLFSILAMGTVSFTYYRGGILSKLATSEETVPVESLEDILVEAERSGMTFGTVRSSYYQQFFEHAPQHTPMRKVWDEVMKPNYERAMVASMDDGIRKVQEEDNYALFASVVRARVEPGYPCALREAGHTLIWLPHAFCLKKDSPYKALVDYSISRLHENGVSGRIKGKYFDRFAVPSCQRFTGSALGFRATFGVFFVLFAGLGLCLAWLVVEGCCGNVAGMLRGRRGGVPSRVGMLHALCDAAMEDVGARASAMSLAEEEWFLRRLRSRLLERIADPSGRTYVAFAK